MERLIEYAGNHPWLVSAALALALAVLAFELRSRANAFAALGPQDAIRLMNQGALVLDIRTPEAFATAHIGGARHLSSDQILTAGDHLKKHKDKPIVVYDETGSVGAAAARQLAQQGFTKAFNLRGGLAAWRGESLPLTKS